MNRKKIWIGIAALVVFLLAAFFYLSNRGRSLSPPGTATLTSGGITIKVDYSRPSVRGRVIFGTEQQQALQPYGQYWRLGANEATKIMFNRNVLFNNKPVRAGTYRMYAYPGPESFDLRLNTDIRTWGASEPDVEDDVLSTQVPVEKITVPVEQFTISLAPAGEGITMVMEWSDVRLIVPVKAQ